MNRVELLGNEVIQGKQITKEEALWLYQQPLDELSRKADEIRSAFCSNGFDLCTIINGKSGRCSENCRFCAQSAHNHTGAEEYPLLSAEEILEQAKRNEAQGVLRYSIVTSGKRLSDDEVDKMCEAVRRIREETRISVCISFGLLPEEQYRKLKEAGVTRVHNNLETSRRNFPNICTTHTFDDKIAAIRAAQAAGLSVCSGGIMGLGETPEDRIEMALLLRALGVKSVPVNMLNPIPGTPLERNEKLTPEDMCRIVAVYRFILPDASIRLAGGRGLLPDKGRRCFQSGANAAISGDMLTTAGITVETDMKCLTELGYEVRRGNEPEFICYGNGN
jgi:biotin synthase